MSVDVSKHSCGTGDTVRDYVAGRLSSEVRTGFEEHFFGCDDCWSELSCAIELRAVLQNSRRSLEEADLLEASGPARDDEPTAIRPAIRSSSRWIRAVAVLFAVALIAGGTWLSRPLEEQPRQRRVLVLGETAIQFTVRVEIDGDQVVPTWPRVPAANSYNVELRDRNGEEITRRRTSDTNIVIPRESIEDGGLFYCRVEALDADGEVLIESALQGISIAPVTDH